MTWDKFQVFQIHRSNTPFIGIGKKPVLDAVTGVRHTNPIKRALYYQQLLDESRVDSHAELAEHLGVVRSRVSTILNLLNLNDEIRSFMLRLDDDDERLKLLNERRLRPLALIKEKGIQKEQFWDLIGGNDAVSLKA